MPTFSEKKIHHSTNTQIFFPDEQWFPGSHPTVSRPVQVEKSRNGHRDEKGSRSAKKKWSWMWNGSKWNQTSMFFSGEVSQDKVHSAHILTARLFRRRVEMSNWPHSNPDLSPIKKICAIMKKKNMPKERLKLLKLQQSSSSVLTARC